MNAFIQTCVLALALVALPVPAAAAPAIDRAFALSGGRSIFLHCEGAGPFTILLEPGDGGRRLHMNALFDALAPHYQVCDYDRRNMGSSSAAPLPRKAADLTADLFDALAAAKISGPYILFGSSMGGLLVRLHAATHRVGGFVTSNQTGTSSEWKTATDLQMTAAERAADLAWAAGDNNEHIDVNDVSRVIDAAGAPKVPHIIMISTERVQCAAAGICGTAYRAYAGISARLASSGRGGSLRLIDGAHDLYITHLSTVVAAIDEVASAAKRRR